MHGMDLNCALNGLAVPKARHAGKVSTSPEKGELTRLAECHTRDKPALRAHACAREHMEKTEDIGGM